jgi:hypothetical protein
MLNFQSEKYYALKVGQGLLVPTLWKKHFPESDPQPEGRAFQLLKSTAMAIAST